MKWLSCFVLVLTKWDTTLSGFFSEHTSLLISGRWLAMNLAGPVSTHLTKPTLSIILSFLWITYKFSMNIR